MLYAVLAWMIALACAAAVFVRARRLAAIELPSADALVERVLQDSAERAITRSELHRVALDELLGEIDRVTRIGSEWARALSRVSLASGTGLSLLGMSEHPSGRAWLPIAAAFLAGVAGMTGSAWFGRLADVRARHAREHWSAVVRRARVRLTSK